MDVPQWIVQPLVDAGLSAPAITELLFDLAFEVATADGGVDERVRALVAGHPSPVQTAWIDVVSRMLTTVGPAR